MALGARGNVPTDTGTLLSLAARSSDFTDQQICRLVSEYKRRNSETLDLRIIRFVPCAGHINHSRLPIERSVLTDDSAVAE